jgi:hypothetical protein
MRPRKTVPAPSGAPGPTLALCVEARAGLIPRRRNHAAPSGPPALLQITRMTIIPKARRRQRNGGADRLPRLLGRPEVENTLSHPWLDTTPAAGHNALEAWATIRVAHCDAPSGTPDRQGHRGGFRSLENTIGCGRGLCLPAAYGMAQTAKHTAVTAEVSGTCDVAPGPCIPLYEGGER